MKNANGLYFFCDILEEICIKNKQKFALFKKGYDNSNFQIAIFSTENIHAYIHMMRV